MCNGLAICINGDGNIICNGKSSHTETMWDAIISPTEQDTYLKFEVILPKYLKPLWDSGDKTCIEIYRKNNLLNNNDIPKGELVEKVKDWLIQNELQVLKWFIKGDLSQKQKISGNQNQNGQTIKENQYQNKQTIKENQYQQEQEIKGYQYQRGQKIKRYQLQNRQTIKESQHQDDQTIGGHQHQQGQKINGHQYQNEQIIKGKIFIKNMKVGNKKTTKLIKEWSNSDQKEYTLTTFVNWLLKKPRRNGVGETKC